MDLTNDSLLELEMGIRGSEPGDSFKFAGLSFGDIITSALPIIFFLAGGALLLYLISGGLKLMTSGGDPKAVEVGKKIITNAIVGFVVIFVAYWLVQIAAEILGLGKINATFIN